MPKIQGSDYKPLVKTLEKLNQKLYWLLPVSKIKKKLYDLPSEEAEIFSDIVLKRENK